MANAIDNNPPNMRNCNHPPEASTYCHTFAAQIGHESLFTVLLRSFDEVKFLTTHANHQNVNLDCSFISWTAFHIDSTNQNLIGLIVIVSLTSSITPNTHESVGHIVFISPVLPPRSYVRVISFPMLFCNSAWRFIFETLILFNVIITSHDMSQICDAKLCGATCNIFAGCVCSSPSKSH